MEDQTVDCWMRIMLVEIVESFLGVFRSPVAMVKKFSLLARFKNSVSSGASPSTGGSAHSRRMVSTSDIGSRDGPGFEWIENTNSAGEEAWNNSSGHVKSICISWRTIRGTELWKMTKAESRRKT